MGFARIHSHLLRRAVVTVRATTSSDFSAGRRRRSLMVVFVAVVDWNFRDGGAID